MTLDTALHYDGAPFHEPAAPVTAERLSGAAQSRAHGRAVSSRREQNEDASPAHP